MSSTQTILMQLLKSEVCGIPLSAPLALSEQELTALYRLARRHDLAHIVGEALQKLGALPEGSVGEALQKQRMLAVYRRAGLDHELSKASALLEEGEIPFIPLKGAVLAALYPAPHLRTSCDIDILVHQADLARAQALLTENGFTFDKKGSHDVSLYSKGGVHLELHYTLIESKMAATMEKPLLRVWQYARPADGARFRHVLTDGMLYYYHVAHMAKHYVEGGCGIRPFLDLWLLCHQKTADADMRKALLAEGGLLTFERAARALTEVWLGDAAHDDLTLRIEQYLLGGGVYGTRQNRVALQQSKKGGKAAYALSRIFLPYEQLKFHYPTLEKHKWLLPVCQVRRWGKLLFHGGVGRSAGELKDTFSLSPEQQKEAAQMLRDLGL